MAASRNVDIAMPVTARLSQLFYERLGEQVANELVDWFNAVDAAYRLDLRELNDRNFALFDAKLEQRLSAFETKLEQRLSAFEAKLEQRLSAFEAKLEQRMGASENRLSIVETKLDTKLDTAVFQHAMAQFGERFAQLEARIERRFTSQSRWLALAWGTVTAAMIGLYFRP